MPAQGQIFAIYHPFLDGETTDGAQCSNQPSHFGITLEENNPALLHCPPVTGLPIPRQTSLVLGGGCSSSGPCFLPRKAVKATLVLLPLLGITYMLFFVNPGEDEISRIVFIYFNSFLESFQVWSSALAPVPVLPLRDVKPILWLMPHPPPSKKQTSLNPMAAPNLLSLGPSVAPR